jgi:hypothetical protein
MTAKPGSRLYMPPLYNESAPMTDRNKPYVSYPGFCTTYGMGKSILAAYVTPPVLQAAINLATAQPLINDNTGNSILYGIWGFAAGAFAHIAANKYASSRGMGITRGGRLVKAWQAAAYAVPVTLGLAAGNLLHDTSDTARGARQDARDAARHIQMTPQTAPKIGHPFALR